VTPRTGHHPERVLGSDYALEVWQRRKWLAVVIFSVTITGAVAVAHSLPNLYRATATVLVERQQVSEAFVRPSVTAELETRIQTIHQQVMSRARLSDVITKLGLYPDLRGNVPLDAIVEMMRRDIQLALKGVEQTTGRTATIAFTISYTGRDPEKVARAANTLVDFYVEENTESRERQATRTAEFLKTQLDDSKRELDQGEQRSSEFKLRYAGELPQQLEANLAALERLNTQLRLNSEYQIRAIERRERLEQQLADTGSVRSTAPQTATPTEKLRTLEHGLADLRRQFSDLHPNVIRVRAEIAALRQAVIEANDDTANAETAQADSAAGFTKQAVSQVDKEIRTLKDEEGFLRQVIAGYEARVENAPKREEELQRLSRDYDLNTERYEMLLKKYEEAQLAESLEHGQNVEQFRVLDPALPPLRPAAPNRSWLLIIGFAAALALGFGAIVAAERFDTTFHSADDLRAFANVPMVAAIRWIPTTSDMRRHRFKFALTTIVVIVGLGLVAAGSYYVADGNEQIVRMTARGRG
jgi:polysaccharide chain length determinant protein (PEP-CTERM system associated)